MKRDESSLSLDFGERRKQPRFRTLKKIFVCPPHPSSLKLLSFYSSPHPTCPFICIGQKDFSRTIEFFQESLSRNTAVVEKLKL